VRAKIWGCRGSLATPGDSTGRYGGNTSSIEIRTDSGALVILDAGTGIRNLGLSLGSAVPRQIHLLLTHMHLDHVEGLGFFPPILNPDCTITIWGPRPESASLAEHVAAYLSPPLFPLHFEQLRATFEFVEIREDSWQLDGLSIRSAPVRHPGPTVGYRLEEDGRVLAFIPDNEPGLEPESGLDLATGADVLLHDAQYTTEEYTTRVGWGHTGLEHLAAYAQEARPGRLLMFHHDPAHSDDMLEVMKVTAQDQTGREVEIAAEGLELELGPFV
jgi:phosphoribosyl 1,2-cyclic phosphodiesterase